MQRLTNGFFFFYAVTADHRLITLPWPQNDPVQVKLKGLFQDWRVAQDCRHSSFRCCWFCSYSWRPLDNATRFQGKQWSIFWASFSTSRPHLRCSFSVSSNLLRLLCERSDRTAESFGLKENKLLLLTLKTMKVTALRGGADSFGGGNQI